MPSRPVKLGLVQMSMGTSPEKNLAKAVEGVEDAARKGAQVVCLPELFAWRYFPSIRDSQQTPQPIPGPASSALAAASRKAGVILVGGSIYEQAGGSRFNTSLLFDEKGRTLSKYRKVHIPQDEHYYEQDYFTPGKEYAVAKTSAGTIGTLICFDQWYPEAARVNRLMGAEVLFYPTAIGWLKGVEQVEGDWKKAWEAVQVGHAVANSMIVCTVNRVGTEGDTEFWGGSFVVDQFGKLLFRAGSEEGVYVVDCDIGLGRLVEEGWGFMRNRQRNTYSRVAEK